MKRQTQTDDRQHGDNNFHKSSFSKTGNCVEVAFHTSSFSNGKECVEVGDCDCGNVMVRDTKDSTKLTLAFTRSEWTAFVKGVKHGEFDIV